MDLINQNLVDFIVVVGFIQAILFAILILRSKIFKNPSNQYFAYFLLIIVVIGLDSSMSKYYYQLSKFWFTVFDLLGDDIPWIMVFYLPLFTFFLKATNSKIGLPLYLFYLPFLLYTLLNLLIDLDYDFHLISVPFLTANREILYASEDYIALSMFLGLHMYTYFVILKNSPNKWLQKLWWYSGAIIVIWVAIIADHLLFEDRFTDLMVSLLWTSVSVFIFWLIYTGLFQFNLANNRKIIKEKLNQALQLAPSPKPKSRVPNGYFDNLLVLMEKDAIYRDSNLGRETVAQQLGISNSYLTQLIKENTGDNFTSFINQYRVKDVERMLQDDSFENFDVLSIGLEAGFKSKTGFYSTFKKINGLTPSQFRNNRS